VPTFEARALHAQILAMLERAADADEHVQELAYHAWESGDPVKTALYNERAGEEALALRALPEALKCMQRVLDASRDIETRARVLEGIGALERLQGHYDRARDAFEAAQALQLDRGDVDRAAVVAGSVLGMRYNMGDETALPNAERFLAEHRDALSAGARNHLLVTCARVAAALYDFALAELLLDQIEDAAALPPAIRQTYLIVQLMRHTFAGDVEQWKRAAAEVDDLLPKLTPEWVVSIETALAVTGTFLGMNDQVARALDRAERVEREWVFRGHRLYRIATLATYLYQRGELARVRACLEEVADHIDVVPALTMAAPAAALFAATVGETALWERLDAGLVTAARGRLTDPDCLLLLGAHAALPARSGATAQAQSDLRAAVGGLPRAAPETMYVLLNAAAILPIEELERVAALAGDATRTKSESAIATDALVRATIASRMGLTAEARTQGEAAAGHYKSLGWPLLEARALELADDLDAARAIYLRCEAFGDLRRLDGGSTRAADDRLASLSTREAEVASLVGRGLRNAQVAAKLSIGIKTVEKHLASVFAKLGVDSRSQVAAFMATGSAGRLADRPHRGS
jgi:DNA-binding NarL/FixJ family response regulator